MRGSCGISCWHDPAREVPAVGPEIILVFYLMLGLGAIGLAVLLYVRAMASRAVYRCPQCQEIVTVELMQASRCNTCGAPLSYPGRGPSNRREDYDGSNP
jgi:DNA-directed RNA polymerase subunit RPC12/RpoP